MNNFVLVLCDSHRTYSPLTAAILAREFSTHPVLQNWHIRSAGAFAGPLPQEPFAPLVAYARSKGLDYFPDITQDMDTEELQAARFAIVCEPDTMELLSTQIDAQNSSILFLPSYCTTTMYTRIPDPLLGEIPVPEFFDVVHEATLRLYEREFKGMSL
jgi:hypothetical protein